MAGIDNIKVIVGFVLDLTADAQKALADKEFNFKDSFLFIDNVAQIPSAVRSAKKFWEEFQDLDDQEQAEIVDFVCSKLECTNDKAKRIIVQAFKTAISVSEVVMEGIELAQIIKAA